MLGEEGNGEAPQFIRVLNITDVNPHTWLEMPSLNVSGTWGGDADLRSLHSRWTGDVASSFLLLLLSPLFPGDGGACLFSVIHIGALNSLRNSDSIYLESKSLWAPEIPIYTPPINRFRGNERLHNSLTPPPWPSYIYLHPVRHVIPGIPIAMHRLCLT